MSPALPALVNWYCVYLLKSKKSNYIYIGCTTDLERRMKEHEEGKVFSTKKMIPLDLIYFEAYKSKEDAFMREKKLKQYGSGLAHLKTRIGLKGPARGTPREGRAG